MSEKPIHVNSPEDSQESHEQTPDHFDTVFVLGQNWREYSKNPELSVESKMCAIAGAEMLISGMTDRLIISGGKTAGKEFPSESEAMKTYILLKYPHETYPQICDENIILEEQSLDTHGNAKEIKNILDRENETQQSTPALLTVGFHTKRASKIFKNHGIETKSFNAEELLQKKSPHYAKFVKRFNNSIPTKLKRLKEAFLRGFLVVDPKGNMVSKLADTFRG